MSNLVNNLYFKVLYMKNKALNVLKNESGEGNLISIILVLAIVVALAFMFKGRIENLFNQVWNKLEQNAVSNF